MSKHFFYVLLLLVGLGSAVARADELGLNLYSYSRPVPEGTIQDLIGKNHKLSSFKGEFVMAMFWSRNCGPCIQELKSLETFNSSVKNKGIRLILISPKQEWISGAEQKRFLRRFGAEKLEAYTDSKSKLAADFGVFTTPNTILINKQGEEIGRIRGSVQWDNPKVIREIYKIKKRYGS